MRPVFYEAHPLSSLKPSGGRRFAYGALLLIAVIIVASEVGGYYYLQRLYSRRLDSSTGRCDKGGSGTSSGNSSGTGPGNANFIAVSTLINYGNGTRLWHNGSNVLLGSNFYDLTVSIANGNVEAQCYPSLNAHYIISINGVRNDNDGIHCTFCWTLWIYCQKDGAWSVSIWGADLIKLVNGDTLAWYYQDTSKTPWQPPQAGAKTVAICS